MRSMVEGALERRYWLAPSTAHAAKPAQAAQACLRWAVSLPRRAGEDEVGQHERTWLGRSPAMRQMIEEAARPQRVTTTVVPTLTRL